MTKRRKTIEKLEGRGNIRLKNRQAVNVRYSLVVFETVDDEADTGQLAGRLAVRGAIEVGRDQGRVDLSGQPFILQTSDGRCLEARTKKGDPVSRDWEIVGAGPQGLEPC